MRVALEINGKAVAAEVAPRTHLADFLRDERLLTGTHIGCEHGVCGACTILLNDAPARACIAYAAACNGARIQTIEGLDQDAAMSRLRAAFSQEHALQCGYCTPGMLVTARDIVLRLPDADDDRVRLELSGNLCRCTGYNGIVRAIRLVLNERINQPISLPPPLPSRRFNVLPAPATARVPSEQTAAPTALTLSITFKVPAEQVWAALRDPALIAACIPGAVLTAIEDEVLTGEITTALGPIRARFTGQAMVSYNDAERSGQISGQGRDRGSNTRLSGAARFVLQATDAGSVVTFSLEYALQGPLAQLGRGSIVAAVASELASAVGQNLQARLRGEPVTVAKSGMVGFLARAIWRALRRRFGLLRK